MSLPVRSPFGDLPLEEREAIIAFVCERYGWAPTRAVSELETWNHVGVAYLKVDMREAQGRGGHSVDHDPGAEMFSRG